MAETENKRPRRTPQERAAEVDSKIEKLNQSITEIEAKKQAVVAEYDTKIAAAQERIKALESKKQEILAPKPPCKPRKTKKQKIQEIVKLAMKSGMSVEEIADQLHVEIEKRTFVIQQQRRLGKSESALPFLERIGKCGCHHSSNADRTLLHICTLFFLSLIRYNADIVFEEGFYHER